MTFRERLEQNPLFFLLAALFAGFTAGIATYKGLLEIAQLEVVPRSSRESTNKSGIPAISSTPTTSPTPQDKTYRVIPEVTPETLEPTIARIRAEWSVRGLLPMEAGRPLSQTPLGTYSFTYAHHLTRSLDDPSAELLQAEMTSRPTTRQYFFEIIRPTAGNYLLIAFVSQTDAAKLATLDGKTPRELVLSPLPWSAANTLIVLPLADIKISAKRSIETEAGENVSILDVTVQ